MNETTRKYVHQVVILPGLGRWIYDGIYGSIFFIRHGKRYNYTERCYALDKNWTAYLMVRDDNIRGATVKALRKSMELFKTGATS